MNLGEFEKQDRPAAPRGRFEVKRARAMGSKARFIVGIDLGTTNCALATVSIEESARRGVRVENNPVLQVVNPGETRAQGLLPSFLYQTGGPELPEGCWGLPWNGDNPPLVGQYAKEQGSRVPGRLVCSAKSWLVHEGVDREAPILPWGSPGDVARISPVVASGAFLMHLVEAWNWSRNQSGEKADMRDQTVVLTIPASFDDTARALTLKAAQSAGLKEITLIEEPQAAFYCWMMEKGPDLGLTPGEIIVVVDVGGGTTDFTLIEAVEQNGEIGLVRKAVGDHLLLGGDNMDMALAKSLEPELAGAFGRLDAIQFQQLSQQCRQAKELLLGASPPESVTVTIQGRGRSLVGGTMQCVLSWNKAIQVILEGFFPPADFTEEPAMAASSGLREFGLPYVADAAVTRHLAAFLRRHGIGGLSAVLFNGGVFQAGALRDRVIDQLARWFPRGGEHPVKVLATTSLDLAVARGAAHFGWLRHAGGRRIGGGIPRSYYVKLGEPDERGLARFLCVLPQNAKEGEEIRIGKPVLSLAVGTPVRFQVYSSTTRPKDVAGEDIQVQPGQLLALPPIQALLRGGKRMGAREVGVTLVSKATELGTLELACAEVGGSNRWVLEFNLRPLNSETLEEAREESEQGAGGASGWDEALIGHSIGLLESVYQAGGSGNPGDLTKGLEATLGAPRSDWPMALCRTLADSLLGHAEQRRRSPRHLSRWLNLTGWCLRPGYGDSRDRYRMDQFWKAIHAPCPGGTMRGGESGIDAWIMLRRVAGGLGEKLQQAVWERLKVSLMPAKGKSVVKPPANEVQEMWRCAASLERLDPGTKAAMGEVLARALVRPPATNHVYWCLGRLGGRWPTHGPLNALLSPAVAEQWIDLLLPQMPISQADIQAWALALAQLARRTDQRGMDVSEGHRVSVLAALKAAGTNGDLARMVEVAGEIGQDQVGIILGDALPLGLRLECGEPVSTS